ncbi:MAG: helix-turn-helix domain-containing protein [Bacteroidota bacterium]
MQNNKTANKELDLTRDFINRTDRNIFLTGKAGTGKTTFLHEIRKSTLKRHIVVAPTGVAAINAKGTTIHSFFQMAFGPILPPEAQSSSGNIPAKKKFNKKKIDIIRSLDLLIIDEISMVRADLLDGIDQVLRKYKDKTRVFGGVQVLMIGDLQQLAPVIKDQEWNLLRPYYETAYFFSSKAFQESNAISIELKHIYRQQNQKFIDILNEIRNNNISQESIDELNKRHIPDFTPDDKEGYITLTTHNNQADEINIQKLNKIKEKSKYFRAEIDGDFSEHNYPTHEKLELKEGAQVMFVKNDSNPEKRYYNGKIGKIVRLESEKVIVRCIGDSEDIETTPEIWENISYTIDKETNEISENVKGSFTQIPLKLAWAITIHKSQGLTFEKAVIDVQLSFTHGQTYVALSRCKTMEGMVLRKPLKQQSIIHDNTVTSFTKNIEDNPPGTNDLYESEKQYQLNLISELFDFRQLSYPINRAQNICSQNQNTLKGNFWDSIKIIKEQGVDNLIKVGITFQKQLQQLSIDTEDPQTDVAIQERVSKGMEYFTKQIEEFIEKPLEDFTFSTDNKAVKKDLTEQIKKFNTLVKLKEFCFMGLNGKFDSTKYMNLRNDSVFAKIKEPKAVKKEAIANVNPKLFAQLRSYRYQKSEDEDIPPFQIFTQDTLYNMCNDLPITAVQLKKVKGMGKIRVQKYGDDIIDIIKAYCNKEDIEVDENTALEEEEDKKKEVLKKVPTHLQSLAFFKQGLSIDEIAKKREFAPGTIESHLSKCVKEDLIDIADVIGEEKSKEIISAVKSHRHKELSLGELREKLDNKYDWGELRMAINAILEKDNN